MDGFFFLRFILVYCKLDRRIVQREIRQIDNNHYWRSNIDIKRLNKKKDR